MSYMRKLQMLASQTNRKSQWCIRYAEHTFGHTCDPLQLEINVSVVCRHCIIESTKWAGVLHLQQSSSSISFIIIHSVNLLPGTSYTAGLYCAFLRALFGCLMYHSSNPASRFMQCSGKHLRWSLFTSKLLIFIMAWATSGDLCLIDLLAELPSTGEKAAYDSQSSFSRVMSPATSRTKSHVQMPVSRSVRTIQRHLCGHLL